jgi:membrane protein implicated in regulation of membrane protease activity
LDKIAIIVWLVLMVAFLIAEASTVQLICIWFAAGSLSALLVGLLGAELWLQILVFFVVSIVLLASLWPVAKKRFNTKRIATNADALIGKICLVTEDIDPMEGGRVKVGDVTWRAHCEKEISAGIRVKILRIQGAKVIVEEVKNEVEV